MPDPSAELGPDILLPLLTEVSKRMWPDRRLPTLSITRGILLVEALKAIECPRPLLINPGNLLHPTVPGAKGSINLIAIEVAPDAFFSMQPYGSWGEHMEYYLRAIYAYDPTQAPGYAFEGPIKRYKNPIVSCKIAPSERAEVKDCLPKIRDLIRDISGLHLQRHTPSAQGVGRRISL